MIAPVREWNHMGDILRDIQFGVRMLLKRPGLTLAALLCLGLGTGATITMFTIINGTMLRPLPYTEPDRIMWLMETAPKRGHDWLGISYPNFRDWQEQNTSFESMAAYRYSSLSLAEGEEPRYLNGLVTSADLFRVLDVESHIGRNFTPEDDLPGAERVAIFSYGFWQSQFGGNRDILGSTVTIHGESYTVIAVMKPEFNFPEVTDVWVPINRYSGYDSRGQHSLQAVARLKPGVSVRQAREEMEIIAQGLMDAYPDLNTDNGIRVEPLIDHLTADFRAQLKTLIGAVVLVLLIACANVANLLLARATGRGREIAIRSTLGAGGPRIVRQLMTECILLGAVGGLLGLAIGVIGVDLVLATIPVDIPFWMEFIIDWRVIVVLLVVSVATGLLFGIAPVTLVRKTDLTAALKEGGSRSSGGSRHLLRSTLVVGETALALILLVGAGLLIQGFLRLRMVEPGFEPERVLAMWINLPEQQYPEEEQRKTFFGQAIEGLESLPGVSSAGACLTVPMGGSNWGNSYHIEEFPVESLDQVPIGNTRSVCGDYFESMGIPLLRGRRFTEQEVMGDADIVIVNESLALKYWPDGDALGKRLTTNRPDSEDVRWMEIVGVVGDVRHYGLSGDIRPGFYFPYTFWSTRSMFFVVRTEGDPASLAQSVRQLIWSIDPGLAVQNLRPMTEYISDSIWGELFFVRLLSAFAVLALILAMLGLYGVMSYAVNERTREMGIRVAVGARPSRLICLVVGQGMRLVVLGMVIGAAGAVAAGVLLASQFYGISSFEPVPLLLVAVNLSIVAFVANYLPAFRVARQDPVAALRYE